MQAFGVPDITRAQLEEFVQAIVDGRVEVPDPRARVPQNPATGDDAATTAT